MNTLFRRGSAASQRGRVEKSSFPSEAEDQNNDFLARAEQRHFLVLFGDKKYIPMRQHWNPPPYLKTHNSSAQQPLRPCGDSSPRGRAKGAGSKRKARGINPSAPAGHLPEGELAAGQEKPAWAVTQGRLWLLQAGTLRPCGAPPRR